MKTKMFEAEVMANRKMADGVFLMDLLSPEPLMAKPGQFVTLESQSGVKLWPRPFSVYGQVGDGERFSICYKAVGENTRHYAYLKIFGGKVGVIGPLGNPISVKPRATNRILVAGGMGAAGLHFLAKTLHNQGERVTFLYGAKTQSQIVDAERFISVCSAVRMATEEADRLVATDLLKAEIEKYLMYNKNLLEIIACGPLPMLAKTAEIAAHYGVHCQVIMETLMACGLGSCKGCVVPKVGGGYFHLCQDGPTLDASKVDWEAMNRPSAIVAPEKRTPVVKIDMRVILKGQNGLDLVLPSPVLLDSGCFEAEAAAANGGPIDLSCVAAVSSKGTTLKQKDGNPLPRVCETPAGMLNSIGLENPGLDEFISQKLPALKALGQTVIANISGDTTQEFAVMAERLSWAGVRAICLNLSCPNKGQGGRIFSLSADDTRGVVKRVVKSVGGEMFIFAKLSPMAPDVVSVAKAAEEAGADALWCFNTFLGMKIDLITRRPAIGNVYGGLSGPAVMPLALRLVHLVCRQVKIPVVAGTGIVSGADAAEYLIAGARAVTLGTVLLNSPGVATKVYDELKEIVSGYGLLSVKDLTGSLIL